MYTHSAFSAPCVLPSSLQHVRPICRREDSAVKQPWTISKRRNVLLSSTSVAETPNSSEKSFGRGARFPRRLVGLYELERLGVNPEKIVLPDKRAERGLGIAVGLGVVSTLTVPLISPWVQAEAPVAVVIALALAIWAVDTLALNSLLARTAAQAVQNQRRVAVHEAGHFLVAHLLGVRVEDYALPTAGTILAGRETGVKIQYAETGDAYMLAALGMAGIAAECVVFGSSQGGAEDIAEVGRLAKSAGPFGRATEMEKKTILRWGLMQAVSLAKTHESALDMLATAMVNGSSAADCERIIDENVNQSELRDIVQNAAGVGL